MRHDTCSQISPPHCENSIEHSQGGNYNHRLSTPGNCAPGQTPVPAPTRLLRRSPLQRMKLPLQIAAKSNLFTEPHSVGLQSRDRISGKLRGKRLATTLRGSAPASNELHQSHLAHTGQKGITIATSVASSLHDLHRSPICAERAAPVMHASPAIIKKKPVHDAGAPGDLNRLTMLRNQPPRRPRAPRARAR